MSRTVDMRLKGNTFLGDFGECIQTEDLETSTICKDRFIPMHKVVKSADGLYNLVPWPQIEMVSIPKNDIRIAFNDIFWR